MYFKIIIIAYLKIFTIMMPFHSLFFKKQIFFVFLIACISLFTSSLNYCCNRGAQELSLFNEIKKNIEIRKAFLVAAEVPKPWANPYINTKKIVPSNLLGFFSKFYHDNESLVHSTKSTAFNSSKSIFREIRENIKIRMVSTPLVMHSKPWVVNKESERESQGQVSNGKNSSLVHIEYLDKEMWELIFLQIVPETNISLNEFKVILNSFANLTRVNKRFNAYLSGEWLTQRIVERFLLCVTPEVIDSIFMNNPHFHVKNKVWKYRPLIYKKMSSSCSIELTYPSKFMLAFKEVLHDINECRFFSISDRCVDTDVRLNKSITRLLGFSISPNFFVNHNNLLHAAIINDAREAIIELLEKGADCNMKSRNLAKPIEEVNQRKLYEDSIPFVFACKFSARSAIILLQKGADINLIKENLRRCFDGRDMYHSSRDYYDKRSKFCKVIKKLVKKGIDPNADINDSGTLFGYVLEEAARKGLTAVKPELIKFLLIKGANLNKSFKNFVRDEQTPRQFAESNRTNLPGLINLFNEHEKSKNS